MLDSEEYRFPQHKREFLTERELDSFVRNVEKLVRGCWEYKEWISSLRLQGAYRCIFDEATLESATIEVHHTPYTLYDLVLVVINTYPTILNSLIIAYKTIEMHTLNLVGWVPLCKTCHERVHNEDLKVPVREMRGMYAEIQNRYKVPEDVSVRVHSKLTP